MVRGAAAVSERLGISPMVIGLTVVAIGSSLPELAVGIDAALRGSPGLVTGNIVGTNIVNLLLILGISAAVRPILTQRQMMRLDLPVVSVVAVLLFLLSLGGSLDPVAGVILLAVGVAYTLAILWYSRRHSKRQPASQSGDPETDAPQKPGRGGAVGVLADAAFLIGGIALVIVGADWLVSGAVEIASALGVSDVLIGLTVVAIGTSAPELVTSLVATVRGQASMAVGNLIGSSVYNIVFILGLTVLVSPGPVPVSAEVLYVDMVIMIVVSLLVMLALGTGRRLSRIEGIVFISLYVTYLSYLIIART